MTIRRRDFLQLAGAAALAGGLPRRARGADSAGVYGLERFGNARILHMTDTHAQLLPVYFREPSVNLGIGAMQGNPPHLVGRAFLDRFAIRPDSADAYAFTSLDFEKSAVRFGKLGGFAHLKTLIERLRSDAGPERSLLLDGGDLWQGTGLANAMRGADMVEAANLLGIEAMTGHWEFTYGETALRSNLERFKGGSATTNYRSWSAACAPPTRSMPWCCCRITAWTSISSSPAASAGSTSSSAAIPTMPFRGRYP